MLKTEIAESVKCEFCGRNLKQEKLIIIIGDVETKINKEVERCNCIQAKEFWKIQDYKRKKELELQEKREKDRRIEKLYDKSEMHSRLKGYSFQNFKITKENEKAYCKAKEYAQLIKNGERKSLIITGNIGTGKTHLASSIANFLIQSEISVVFGTLINLLNEVKDTYTMENKTESFIIEKYSKVPLLIIDDLGKERPSEWTLEKLFTIINNRYENNLPVVITTNYNRERLRERLANNVNYEIADSIISRLYEMCKGISLNGKDKRKELV